MPSAPAPPPLFVGRAAELDRVARASVEVRLAVVYGVAGVGKTAFLLRAARTIAEREQARMVQVVCEPGDSALLAQVCAFRRPAPMAMLEAAMGPKVRTAAARLAARFLIDWTPDHALEVHELVREAVSRSPRAGPRRARALSALLGIGGRARCRSGAAASRGRDRKRRPGGRDPGARIGAHRPRAAGQLGRRPAGGRGHRHLAARRPLLASVRSLRARIRTRQGEPARAFDDPSALADQEPLADLDRAGRRARLIVSASSARAPPS